MAQVTIKLQSWDGSPNGVSENPAHSLLHTSDTGTPTSVPGFNGVHIIVNVLMSHCVKRVSLQYDNNLFSPLLYLSSVPGGDDAHISWVFNGNNGPGSQQQLFPGLLQVNDVHTWRLRVKHRASREFLLRSHLKTCRRSFPPLTVAFPLVDILIHLEVQVGASQVGSCCQELQHILLLHLKDIQTSGHRDHFPCVTSDMGELWTRRRNGQSLQVYNVGSECA